MKIVILGWGSLLWDAHADFDSQHKEWQLDGPSLRLEFSRISDNRRGGLTLVIDEQNGCLCQVAYAFSTRKNPEDVVRDLRCREGTTLANIGYCFVDQSRKQGRNGAAMEEIVRWATIKKIDTVVWTDLQNNFQEKSENRQPFSIENALLHIQRLNAEGKSKAAEYVWRAPKFIETPLRDALQAHPWFRKQN